MTPSGARRKPEEHHRQFVTMRTGNVAALGSVDFTPDLSFSLFIFVAQRIGGAREILEAGPLAKAERSSEERKRRMIV